jgi:hypothetical protein
MRIVSYRTGGVFATLIVLATMLVAVLLSAAAAAIVLVTASLFAVAVLVAGAIVRRVSGSKRPDFASWPVDPRRPVDPASRVPTRTTRGGDAVTVGVVGRPLRRDATPYAPLSSYLERRHASYVVLTFEQIESLLGFPLPPPASTEQEWWTGQTGDVDGHIDAWALAERTATPNLSARTVAFTRLS